VPLMGSGSWLLNVWGEKSSTTATWTLPGDVTQRTFAAATGSGRVSQVIGDSNGAVAGPTSAAKVATTSVAVNRGVHMSFAITPGSDGAPVNIPPTPAFTVTCSILSCSFDATGSTDADGDVLTYTWAFGDGSSATGALATHTYATAGTRTVTLVANDGTTTAQATRQVTTSLPVGGPGHTAEVTDTVLTNFPRITTGEIWDLEYIGDRVYVVGGFTQIRNNAAGNTTTYNQPYLAAFSMTTGLVDPNFRPVFDGSVQDVEASPEGEVLASMQNAVLLEAVRKLNPEQQECIALRFLQGLSVAETAAVMGKNEGSIKALQYRAVRSLGRLLPEGVEL